MTDIQPTEPQRSAISGLMIGVRGSLPKTRSGKIARRHLEAVEPGEDPGDRSAAD